MKQLFFNKVLNEQERADVLRIVAAKESHDKNMLEHNDYMCILPERSIKEFTRQLYKKWVGRRIEVVVINPISGTQISVFCMNKSQPPFNCY